jgi:uncharacterized protein YraI
MNATLSSARRIGATLAIAGIAALGSVAIAPAASAAQAEVDGPISVLEGNGNGNGPDKFIVLEDGQRIPVFYCDENKPNQRHNNCEAPVSTDGPRF